MAEPDHLILRPIPNLAEGDKPSAFPFFYIEPKKQESECASRERERGRESISRDRDSVCVCLKGVSVLLESECGSRE